MKNKKTASIVITTSSVMIEDLDTLFNDSFANSNADVSNKKAIVDFNSLFLENTNDAYSKLITELFDHFKAGAKYKNLGKWEKTLLYDDRIEHLLTFLKKISYSKSESCPEKN